MITRVTQLRGRTLLERRVACILFGRFCPATMNSNTWTRLLQQPPLPAQRQHYSTLVSDSTTKLAQCVDDLLTVLNDRAKGLTECANFDAALSDASTMQQLSPSSPLGYLCAGSVYSQQGRQRDAIDIYNQGLSKVNKDDPGYDDLQQAKADAVDRDNRRFDLFSELLCDNDLAQQLVPMLMDEKQWIDTEYFLVSNTWREKMMRVVGHDDECHIVMNGNEDPLNSRLARCATRTKSLTIKVYRDDSWLSRLLDHLDLRSLKTIDIQCKSFIDMMLTALLTSVERSHGCEQRDPNNLSIRPDRQTFDPFYGEH